MDKIKNDLERCRQLIEEKIGWGNSMDWQNQDFESLSARVLNETKISLSVSTLKRIWGKISYDGSPNLATLNALAQFAGYENWRAFSLNVTSTSDSIKHLPVVQSNGSQDEGIKGTKKAHLFPSKKNLIVVISIIVVLSTVLVFRSFKGPDELRYDNLEFICEPVTLGLPNTVIFHYDVSQSNADSIFIQQDWDSRRRHKIDKHLHEYTSTYYSPGYFKAKLVLNDSIVKEHDLYIESDGWLGTIDKLPIPIYLNLSNSIKSPIAITPFHLTKAGLGKGDISWVSLFNVKKEINVPSSSFSFQADVRNTFNKGEAICQKTEIVLIGSNGVHSIPISIKGCVGELNLSLGGRLYSGKTNDLSGFGVDFADWATVRFEANGNKTRILVNNQSAFEADQLFNIGTIVGIRIRFFGTGIIRNVTFKDEEGIARDY